jgi:hypothetical protein
MKTERLAASCEQRHRSLSCTNFIFFTYYFFYYFYIFFKFWKKNFPTIFARFKKPFWNSNDLVWHITKRGVIVSHWPIVWMYILHEAWFARTMQISISRNTKENCRPIPLRLAKAFFLSLRGLRLYVEDYVAYMLYCMYV